MSATNATATISLPLFIGTDKPAWLTDWNGAMNTIDSAIATLQTAESGTATSLASLAQSVEALSGTVGQHTTALTTLSTAVSGNTGSINTINSLIGNGQPTTEDKTIIGAINEIYAEIGSGAGVAAEDVTFDNVASGLTATDVQAAIEEVNAKIPAGGAVEADDVVYDNTTSGLSATNVQAAIDELAQGGTGYSETVLKSETGVNTITQNINYTLYDEIDVVFGIDGATWYNIKVPTSVLSQISGTDQNTFRDGYYISASEFGCGAVMFTVDGISGTLYSVNGSRTNATWKVLGIKY